MAGLLQQKEPVVKLDNTVTILHFLWGKKKSADIAEFVNECSVMLGEKKNKSWFYFSGVVRCVWFDCCCDSSSGLLAGRLNLDPSGSTGICNWCKHLSQSSALLKFPW